MSNVDIDFDSKEWDRILKTISKKWKDIETRKTFGGIISSVVHRDVMEHFEKEQGPDGPWQPWSESYTAAIMGLVKFRYINKRIVPIYATDKLFKPPRNDGLILQTQKGTLRQKFTPQSWRSNPEGILFYNNAKTKSGFPYAYAHDTGGPKLPKRSFMWLSNKGMNSIIDQVQKWLAEGT